MAPFVLRPFITDNDPGFGLGVNDVFTDVFVNSTNFLLIRFFRNFQISKKTLTDFTRNARLSIDITFFGRDFYGLLTILMLAMIFNIVIDKSSNNF